jgi:hypothetical protein
MGRPPEPRFGICRTSRSVRMRCQNSSIRPNGMDAHHRIERECHAPSPPGKKPGGPSELRNEGPSPSLRPTVMADLLTGSGRNRTLLIGSGRKATTPDRLGREWGAPRGIGMKCRNPSLRPNEMSELLTAPAWNGMLLIPSEGYGTTPHRPGSRSDAPQSIGMIYRNPSLRPN